MALLSVRLGGLSPEDKAAIEEARKRKEEEQKAAEDKARREALAEPGKAGQPVSYQDKPITNPAYEASVTAREDTRKRVLEEDRKYAETVAAAENQLDELRGGAGRGRVWMVTDPETGEQRELRGSDIDRLQADLDRYKSEYTGWRASTYQRLGAYTDRMRTLSDRFMSTGSYGQPTLRETSAPGLLKYKAEPQQQAGGLVETVRGVWGSQWPTPPSQELSVNDYSIPADTMPLYTEGREPTNAEQLLAVSQVPSKLVIGFGESVAAIRTRIPNPMGGGQNLDQYLALVEGGAYGFSSIIDPATYLALPVVAAEGIKYVKSKNWLEIQADISQTLGEYKETRLAKPALFYGDVGYQLGSAAGFKALTILGKSAGRVVGDALAALPGDEIGYKGLAVIGGESPVPFKQAYQLVRQRGVGISSDLIGDTGLAVIGGDSASLPVKQMLQVVLQKGSIPSDLVGTVRLSQFTGYTGASVPLKQFGEVWLQKVNLRNVLQAEPVAGGLAVLGGDPVFMPIKQLVEVVRQRGSLGSDILGPTGMGTRGTSLKTVYKFLSIPSAVEPTMPRAPVISKKAAGDISGFLKLKADEAAQIEAEKLEAFMKSTFKESPAPVTGAPDTPASTLIQLGAEQRGALWGGVSAVDVFPYEVLSYPPDLRVSEPKAEIQIVERQKPDLSLKQSIKIDSGLGLSSIQAPDLRLGELSEVKLDLGFKQAPKPKLSERQKPRDDIILTVFEVQTERQEQPQRSELMVPLPAVTEQQPKPVPNIFGSQKTRTAKTVNVFGARRYRYKTIEVEDILGFGGGGVNVFGKKRKRREVKIF